VVADLQQLRILNAQEVLATGYQHLASVITGVKFVNGTQQTGDQIQDAA